MLEKTYNKDKKLEAVKTFFDEAITYDREWQTNAEESFGFRDGHGQWTKEEKDILHEEKRPALTLNIVKSHIDLIKGLNEDIKKRYVATPQGVEDAFLCEVVNNVIYWLYNKNDYDAEEENAYESGLICGRGWVSIDFNIDETNMKDIKVDLTSVPPHEVRRDPAGRKRDLSDASYIFWDRWLSIEDFAIKYPKFEQKAREAFELGAWPKYSYLDPMAPESGEFLNNDINDESDYSDPLDVAYFDSKKHQIRVAHMEYWKYVKKYFFYDPSTGNITKINIPWKDFKERFKALWPNRKLRYETRTNKEVWWLQFCGEEILFDGKSPINYPGFSLVPCFLFDDVSRRRGYHYGIVELMKDPQREINKRTSQTLNLFNQQVQPGVYAEPRAFANMDQAEQSLKESGSVTFLQDGAIKDQRFQERKVPTFPSAVLQMGEYAREMIRHITGINPDLLGMNDKRQEPGIVVQLRQQQGMAILKPVFKAYSKMREEIFKRLVAIVMQHMPNHQIVQILGESGRYKMDGPNIVDTKSGLQANFRNVDKIPYDIDTEPESASMTQDALELATFMEMAKNGIPIDPRVLVSKTNIAASEKIGWIKYIEGQQQAQSEAAKHEMDMKMKEMERKHELDMKKLEVQMAIAMRKAEDQREKDILKSAVDQEKLRLQEKRDDQAAQIKATQILTQATLGKQKETREWTDMMLDADIAKKRLILDVAEVMAESRNSQTSEGVKAVVEMYKAALNAKTMDKATEQKMAQSVLDAYVKLDVEDAKNSTAKQKIAVEGANKLADTIQKKQDGDVRSATDLIKTGISEKSKLAAENLKAKSAEKIAKEQAKASVEASKNQAKAAASQAKKDTAQKTKDKPL
jgi:hypothetical protein